MNIPTTNKVTLAIFKDLDVKTGPSATGMYDYEVCLYQSVGIKAQVDQEVVWAEPLTPYRNYQLYWHMFEMMNSAVNEIPPGQVTNEVQSAYRQASGNPRTLTNLGRFHLISVYEMPDGSRRNEDTCLKMYGG